MGKNITVKARPHGGYEEAGGAVLVLELRIL